MKNNKIKLTVVAVIFLTLMAACYNPFLQIGGEREIESGTSHTDSITLIPEGDGSPGNPFLVHNKIELGFVGKGLSNENEDYQDWTLEKCYEQVANIDMDGVLDFKPIGVYMGPMNIDVTFTGIYNGGGYAITNLRLGEYNSTFYGLFACVADNSIGRGIIENLGLVNIDFRGWQYSGAIVGDLWGGTVRNCYVTGKINGDKPGFTTCYIGGIAGRSNGLIENCFTAFEIISGSTALGATASIVAVNTGTVRNCMAISKEIDCRYLTGRVSNESGILINNYAWGEMIIPKFFSLDDSLNDSLDGKDGKSLSANDIKTETQWTTASNWNEAGDAEAWDFDDVWVWDDDLMPRLKNSPELPWPGYLVDRDGSIDYPFLVHDEKELGYVGKGEENPVKYQNWTLDMCYQQVANIDMTEIVDFKPIGTSYDEPFRGKYDGGGHAISNLKVGDYVSTFVGLFGYINGSSPGIGVVENLAVVNVDLKGKSYYGTIAGYILFGKIKNCFATGKINDGFVGPVTGGNGGGIAGYNDCSIIENCYTAYEGINEIYQFGTVGGIAGYMNYSGIVQNCMVFSRAIGIKSGGRIAYKDGTSALINNYAWGERILSGILPFEDSLDGKDGESLLAIDIKTETQWTNASNWYEAGDAEAWDFDDVWVWETGYMPKLKHSPKLPWPGYLVDL